VNGASRIRLARLNSNGTPDPKFDPALEINGRVLDVKVQDDGKIIIAGEFTTVNGFPRSHIARLNGLEELAETFPITAFTFKSGQLQITFESDAGATYELLGTRDIANPGTGWSVVETGILAASDSTQVSVAVPAGEDYQFFLIRRIAP
jgi:hypothetical protein